MKALLAIAAALLTSAACKTNPPPTQPVSPSVIYQALVEGGCMKADPDGGLAAVMQEAQMGSPPPWFLCLEKPDGGIASCGVPCD